MIVPDAYCRLPEEVVSTMVPAMFRKEGDRHWSWFRADEASPPRYRFLEESLSRAEAELLPQARAFCGHSQGGMFACLLLAQLHARRTPHPQVQFVVAINMPAMPRFSMLMDEYLQGEKIKVPLLYFRSPTDRMVPNIGHVEAELKRFFERVEVQSFEGHHFPPLKSEAWASVDEWMAQFH